MPCLPQTGLTGGAGSASERLIPSPTPRVLKLIFNPPIVLCSRAPTGYSETFGSAADPQVQPQWD